MSIDLRALIEQRAGVRLKFECNHRLNGAEYSGPCPFCKAGTDRFRVWPEADTPRWWCRVCERSGTAAWFLVEYEGLSYPDALDELGIESSSEYSGPHTRRDNPDRPPSAAWQEVAKFFALVCKQILWSPAGKAVLDWLRQRGLSDETIEKAGLGYNPAKRIDNGEQWGFKAARDGETRAVWLPRGITIPWRVDGELWGITIRRSDKDVEADGGEKKYISITGSKEGLYNSDALLAQPDLPVVLVEGEFDALLLGQETGDACLPIATGGTRKARSSKWQRRLQAARPLLIAFDNDAPGREAARYWRDAVPAAVIWFPWQKDITDMYKGGDDLRAWLSMGLDFATPTPVQAAEAAPTPHAPRPIDACPRCGSDPARWQWHDNAGAWLCLDCRELAAWANDEAERQRRIERKEIWI